MFRKAERKKAKLRLGIMGASGSGKTCGALEIAFGMTTGDKIFFIDTESGRGELYQGAKSRYDSSIVFDYNYYRLEAPFSPRRYIEAIKDAEKNGCEVLIIDSLSHAWSGDGGVLSIVDNAGGQFQSGWKKGTPEQNALIDTIIASKMHIICNLRTKTEYVVELNDRGKNAPRKIGLAPIQRDQIEYEFTVFLSMNQDKRATASKDNTDVFVDENVFVTPEMGKRLLSWLNQGADPVEPVSAADARDIWVSEVLPQIIYDFDECETEMDLRNKFIALTKEHRQTYAIEMLIEAKDKRKFEIQNNQKVVEALKEVEPQVPVEIPVAKTSKHSSKLTQLARGA